MESQGGFVGRQRWERGTVGMSRFRSWLFGDPHADNLITQYERVWKVKAIRTGPADTKRKEHEARVVSFPEPATWGSTASTAGRDSEVA